MAPTRPKQAPVGNLKAPGRQSPAQMRLPKVMARYFPARLPPPLKCWLSSAVGVGFIVVDLACLASISPLKRLKAPSFLKPSNTKKRHAEGGSLFPLGFFNTVAVRKRNSMSARPSMCAPVSLKDDVGSAPQLLAHSAFRSRSVAKGTGASGVRPKVTSPRPPIK